ncbi:MAG: electron transport complex subunit RsxC [Gammaproteobacteria bacterium]|nr:electron transport complex subunit RsxC [Gammaproteobacteria bacterium]
MLHPIVVAPAPNRVVIPIGQCLGQSAEPLVRIGQDVLAGEPIARTVTGGSSPKLHASISGTVTAIREHAVPGSGDARETCVFIEGDGRDASYTAYENVGDPLQMRPERICKLVAEAGIVGLGGALFSTADKLAHCDDIHTLILNGTECEPYITCDEILMREHARRILHGARVMMRAVGATRMIVGIESDMPEARVAMWDVIEADGLDDVFVSIVTAKYPAGGERQLIQLVTGEEVPDGGWPGDIGYLCQNVGTAAAVADLFREGRPLISRVVTVTGRGIAEPVNIDARIGTLMEDLFGIAGGTTDEASHLIMGGPMMGVSVPSADIPITKATNCLIVMTPAEISPTLPEMPCIRCGECSQVCPAQLLPQELLNADRRHDMAALTELGLDACIECGCCDYVCPSQILLTDRFVESKARLRDFLRERQRAERAQRRFEAREARLAAAESTREAELQKQIDDLQQGDSIDDILARVDARDGDEGGER